MQIHYILNRYTGAVFYIVLLIFPVLLLLLMCYYDREKGIHVKSVHGFVNAIIFALIFKKATRMPSKRVIVFSERVPDPGT